MVVAGFIHQAAYGAADRIIDAGNASRSDGDELILGLRCTRSCQDSGGHEAEKLSIHCVSFRVL